MEVQNENHDQLNSFVLRHYWLYDHGLSANLPLRHAIDRTRPTFTGGFCRHAAGDRHTDDGRFHTERTFPYADTLLSCFDGHPCYQYFRTTYAGSSNGYGSDLL